MSVPAVHITADVAIPQVGFGVFQVPEAETQAAVEAALEVGYRHIDTATIYGNERGVGAALSASGIARNDVFVTSKLWIDDFARDRVIPAVEASLERLGLDQVDLYLLHWPAPQRGEYVGAWSELQTAQESNLARAVGVSNFTPTLIDELIAKVGVTPPINQVQLNPTLQQPALHAYHR